MKQITEDYVSYEIAVLLKEKGFKNEYCDNMLLAEDGDTIWKFATFTNRDDAFDATMKFKKQIPLVTHQMALKWLREVHLYHIFAKPVQLKNRVDWRAYIIAEDCDTLPITIHGESPEQGIEEALKYTLKNLI